MDPLNEPNTAFMLNHGNYYYNDMPFSLKNIGSIYQWLMDTDFSHQVGRNLEVYVDEIIVKTTEEHSRAADLKDVL